MSDARARLVAALGHHRAGRLSEARTAYREVLREAPDHPDALHLLGVACYQAGELEEAERLVREAVRRAPASGSFRSNLGNVLRARGDAAGAEAEYRQALELAPAHVDARCNLANLLLGRGRPDEAEAELRTLLHLDPEQPAAWNALGLVARGRGDEAAAREAFERALACDPDAVDAAFNLGNLQFRAGEHAAAAETLARVVELRPDDVEARRVLALALLECGAPEAAEAWLAVPVVQACREPAILLAEGTVAQALGRHEQAATAYRSVLQADPACADALNNLGTLAREARDLASALEHFDAALARDPAHARAHFNRGSVLSALGRIGEAERSLLSSCELAPAFGAPREALIDLYERAGDREALVRVLAAWRERMPDDPIASHLAAAHGLGAVPDRCAPAYVVAEFDRAAETFDARLDELDYRMPQRVGPCLEAWFAPEARGTLRVLDAGCGTGLCGPALRPWARRLDGVDLSGRMLALARERGCYDELVEGELLERLRAGPGAWDVIVAMDVLLYFGRLDEPVEALAGAVAPGGVVLFSLERTDGNAPFLLRSSGRYAHGEAYVRSLLSEAGFPRVALDAVILRRERGVPVWGHLVRASRAGGGPGRT